MNWQCSLAGTYQRRDLAACARIFLVCEKGWIVTGKTSVAILRLFHIALFVTYRPVESIEAEKGQGIDAPASLTI